MAPPARMTRALCSSCSFPSSNFNSLTIPVEMSPRMDTSPLFEVRFTFLPAERTVPTACVRLPFDVREIFPVAVRLPLLVRVPFVPSVLLARRFSTEISPVTFRLIATVSASELSLMRTSPAMAGLGSAFVSMPSTMILLNWFPVFSNSRVLLLKVFTVSAEMAPLSVWVMVPLTAFRVSVFFVLSGFPAFTAPSSVRLSLATRVTLPPALMEPATAVFTTFPELSFSSSRPTAREPSLFATNSPVVLTVPRSRVPFCTPWEMLPMPRI